MNRIKRHVVGNRPTTLAGAIRKGLTRAIGIFTPIALTVVTVPYAVPFALDVVNGNLLKF